MKLIIEISNPSWTDKEYNAYANYISEDLSKLDMFSEQEPTEYKFNIVE